MKKSSLNATRRTLMLAAVAALGITTAGKSTWAGPTEQVQDYNGASAGHWGTNTNWAGGAGTTVPNNGGGVVYVVDTATGNAGPVDLDGGSFTIAGIGNISGSTLHLTEIENTAGTATLIIDPNTLPIPAASTLNSAVTNSGTSLTLQFGQNSSSNNQPGVLTITSTINGLISGHVNLIADGPDGDLLVTAANTYSGATTIENGATLTMNGAATIGAVGLSGGSTFNVSNNISITDLTSTSASDNIDIGVGDTLTITPTGNDTVTGVIDGGGGLTLAGAHTLTLANNNTYFGGTIINAGATLNVTGSIEDAVTDNGTFEVNNSFTIGDLTGGTSGKIILGSGDTLTIDNSNNDTYAGTVSGMGGLTIQSSNSSIQTLSETLTYKGQTTIDSGGSLTFTGTGDSIGAVVDDGVLTIDPNVTITDLNGSGVLNLNGTDVLTVKTTMDDTFSGALNGASGTGLAVDGNGGGSLALTGNLTGYTGSFNISKNGVLDISTAANTPDTSSSGAYESGDTVHYWVNFDNTINFGSVHAELITGNGNITSAQSTSFSNSGYTNQQSLGEELSGTINLNVTSSGTSNITATIDGSGDTTLISGEIVSNTNPSTLLLENGTFILSNSGNSTNFTTGTLQIGDSPATLQFGNVDELPATNVPIQLDNGTLQPTAVVTVANPIQVSDSGGTIDVGHSDSSYDNPVVFSGQFTNFSPGIHGQLNIIDSTDNYEASVALTNNTNNYAGGTTMGNSSGFMFVFAGGNNVFGAGSLSVGSNSVVGTTNDIESGDSVGTGAWGATPIHITVGGLTISGEQSYAALAMTGFATNITFSGGMYHVNNANTGDTTNDALIVTGTGNANLSESEGAYLNTDAFGATAHPRPYDFSQYVLVNTGSGGTITGQFGDVFTGTDAYMTQTVQSNGAGGQELVATFQTDFAEMANNSNAYKIAHYLDTHATPGNEANLSPALISALITLSQGSYAQIAQVLNEMTAVDYASLGDQAIQNSTYESQQIFGQIDSAFSTGGFNTGGLALLKTSGTAPDPFSTALQSSLNSSAQMAQNVASLSSVNFMDDTDNGAGSSPPIPQEETPESQLSGFVSGNIVMSTLPEGNALGQPHYTTGGVTAGIDYRLNENWIIGGYFNYGYTGATLDYLGSRQQTSSYSPGLFVGYQNGPWFIDALGSYTYNDYRVDRNFNMPGAGTATGKPTSNQYDLASLFGFYVPAARNLQVGPAGGFAYTNVDISSFNETGSPFDLNVSSHSVDSLRSLLGGQAKYMCNNNTLPVEVTFNAFWQHEFLNGGGGISAGLNNIIGPGTFVFDSTGPSRDSALVGGGLSGDVTKNITVFANYEAQVGDKDVFGQSIIAGLSISFK